MNEVSASRYNSTDRSGRVMIVRLILHSASLSSQCLKNCEIAYAIFKFQWTECSNNECTQFDLFAHGNFYHGLRNQAFSSSQFVICGVGFQFGLGNSSTPTTDTPLIL